MSLPGPASAFRRLLRKADKTFERHETDNYTAVNAKG